MSLNDALEEFKEFLGYLDNLVLTLKDKYSYEVTCRPGCCDCCFAYFDISPLEALYIKRSTIDRITQDIVNKARIYRETYLKQEKLHPNRRKIKCPFLTDEKTCAIYEFRPINCRIYGLPVSFNDVSHVCGLTRFEKKKTYDTIKMDKIHGFILKLMQKEKEFSNIRRRVRLDELVLDILNSDNDLV